MTREETELPLHAGEARIVRVSHRRPNVKPGDRIGLTVDPTMVNVFDQKSGQRLTTQ